MNVVKLVPELNPTADRLEVCVFFFSRVKYINERRKKEKYFLKIKDKIYVDSWTKNAEN